MSKVKACGDLNATLTEGLAGNLLNGTRYTKDSPYLATGVKTDIYYTLDNYCAVTAGKTYYLVASCYPGWATSHLPGETYYGYGTIWLYTNKTFNASSYSFDTATCFHANSTNKVAEGVWKYTIPSDRAMARVRVNTYSDGETSVTAKFWDIALIPEEEYTGIGAPAMRVLNENTTVNEIIEL